MGGIIDGGGCNVSVSIFGKGKAYWGGARV